MRKIIPLAAISILAILLLAGCTETTKDLQGSDNKELRTYTGEIYDAIYKQKASYAFWDHDKVTILFTDGYSITIETSGNSSLTVAGVYAFCKDRINETIIITYNQGGVVYSIREG